MNISKIDFHNFLYLFLTLIFCSILTITSANSQENLKYRYKANGVILGEKIIIPNGPPVIGEVSAPDSYTGETYSYLFSGTDPDGDALAWFWSGNTPTGLSLNSATGEITGTPDMEGVYNFQISLSDSINGSVSTNVSIEILGCTNGPIGAVCGDGMIYLGEDSGNRIYVAVKANNSTYDQATNSCDYFGNRIPTRAEITAILPGMNQTGNTFYRVRNWTSESYPSSSTGYYVYNKSTEVFESFSKNNAAGYACVRN